MEGNRDLVSGLVPAGLAAVPVDKASAFWRRVAEVPLAQAVSLRLGTLPTALEAALDLLAHHLPEAPLSVSVGAGVARWHGSAAPERIRLLRHAAAQQEMPLTLERAPWDVRHQVGHFGAYREGVGRLVGALRATFDPARVLAVSVSNDE